MAEVTVLADRPAEGIARLRLRGDGRMNPMDGTLRAALLARLDEAIEDDTVKAIVIAGDGENFSAGGDIKSMDGLTLEAGRRRIQSVARVVRRLAEAPKPVVAAVRGYAVGAGASLTLLADSVVAGQEARFGFPFFRIGLIPDWGALHTLPRRVGPQRARQLFVTGRLVAAEEALSLGLADQVVPEGQLDDTAIEAANQLAALPPMAFDIAKRQLNNPPASLDAALEAEALAQAACFVSDDAAEGRAAFFAKRSPEFGRKRG
ncbi:MAG: enoyl-CoA hydratase/isomerase family protein [Azospirillaceae bacterium]